jgi:hypothetical protein
MSDKDINHPLAPKRRWFLKSALAIGAAGAVFGGLVYWKRGISDGRLTEHGRDVFKAVSRAVFWDVLPKAEAEREAKLGRHMARLNDVVASMPAGSQMELAGLLGALVNTPTRQMLTGLKSSWAEASVEEVTQALNAMRFDSSMATLVPYHVLRDLTSLAFFSNPENWSIAAYPGPLDV